jgi:hypothetical protein
MDGASEALSGRPEVMAQGVPGRTFSGTAIEMRLDFAGEVAPHVPADRSGGDWTEDPDEVIGVLLGEYSDPLRSGAVQGSVNVGERAGQLDSALVGLGESVAALLLVLA